MSAIEMESIFRAGADLVKKGEPHALVTVTEYKGHNARHEGSMMLVKKDGSIVGTVGGSALEKFAIETSLEFIKQNKSAIVDIGPTSSLGMVCGGSVKLFIKSVPSKDTLVIFGAGHVAIQVSRLAKMLNFNVVVVDDRPEWANQEKFPDADRIILEQPEKAIEDIPLGRTTYALLMSYSGEIEKRALRLLLQGETAYIGLISSPTKALEFLDYLLNYFDLETLKRIRAPLGLDIGDGQIPAEIAMSALAEILTVKYGRTGLPLSRTESLLAQLAKKKA